MGDDEILVVFGEESEEMVVAIYESPPGTLNTGDPAVIVQTFENALT